MVAPRDSGNTAAWAFGRGAWTSLPTPSGGLPTIAPMDLANMRANGVSWLDVQCHNERRCTEPALRRQGFTVGLLVGLVGTGYAVVKPETMVTAGKTFNVVRFVVTDLGRQAIGT
jgi:hypothetical protein